MRKRIIMKSVLSTLKWPLLIGLLLVAPFMVMEYVNRQGFNEGSPIPLFIILWLLPVAFSLSMMPIIKTVRVGKSIFASPIILLTRAAFLVLIAWMWTGILVYQMPCFLEVPNCD